MAASQEYNPTQTVAPQTGMPEDFLQAKATPAAFGANVAQGLGEVGKGATEVGNDSSKLALEFQNIQLQSIANENSNNYGTMISKAEADFRLKRGQDAVDGLTPFLTSMKGNLDQMAANIKSPVARQTFLQDARSFFNRTAYSTSLYAGDQAKAGEEESWKGRIKTINDFTTKHYDDPVAIQQGITDTANASLHIASSMGLKDADAVNSHITEDVGNLIYSTVASQIGQGETVQARMKSLDLADKTYHELLNKDIPGFPGVTSIDAKHQDMLNNMIQSRRFYLEREEERLDRTNQSRTRSALNDHYKNISALNDAGQNVPASMFPSEAQIRAGFPPEEQDQADEAVEKFKDQERISHFAGDIKFGTPEQINKDRLAIRPDPDQPESFDAQSKLARAFDTALDARNKVLRERPADYVIANDTTIENEYRNAGRDPTKWAMAFVDNLARQDTMGVPKTQQRVLPEYMAKQYADSVLGDVKNTPQTLKELQQQFGNYWPQVFRDMVQVGKLPIEVQAVSHLGDRDADLLSTFLSQRKAGTDVNQMIPDPKQRSALVDRVKGHMTAFEQSRAQAGATPQQTDSYVKAAVDLAYANVYYGGMDPTTAADAAVKAFEGNSKYIPGSSARVPAEKFDNITNNTQTTSSQFSSSNIAIPKGIGGQGQPGSDEYIETLKSTPRWINNPNGDGLWLKDIGGRIVRRPNGQPVEVPFDAPPIKNSIETDPYDIQ